MISIIGGIYFVIKKTKLTSTVYGTVETSNCTLVKNIYDCSLTVKYTDNKGKEHSLTGETNDSYEYTKGAKILVYYDPSNPSKSSLTSDNSHIAGWVAIVIGVILIFSSFFWLWASMKYKFIAAAEGVSAATGMIRGSLR